MLTTETAEEDINEVILYREACAQRDAELRKKAAEFEKIPYFAREAKDFPLYYDPPGYRQREYNCVYPVTKIVTE